MRMSKFTAGIHGVQNAKIQRPPFLNHRHTETKKREQRPKRHHKAVCFAWIAQRLLKLSLPESHGSCLNRVTHANLICKGLAFWNKESHSDAKAQGMTGNYRITTRFQKQMKRKDLKTGFCPKKHYQLVT